MLMTALPDGGNVWWIFSETGNVTFVIYPPGTVPPDVAYILGGGCYLTVQLTALSAVPGAVYTIGATVSGSGSYASPLGNSHTMVLTKISCGANIALLTYVGPGSPAPSIISQLPFTAPDGTYITGVSTASGVQISVTPAPAGA